MAVFGQVTLDEANARLVEWGHYLGEFRRPFGREAWGLEVAGELVAVAVSGSTVSTTAAGLNRGELVELARLCARPGANWASRVAVRLWREVAGPAWPYWPVAAAIAYSQNERHEGRLYRFDGWERVTTEAGMSGGGGGWSGERRVGQARHGRKTLWRWSYEAAA